MSNLFSKQNKEAFGNPLNLDHPILVQVLGICYLGSGAWHLLCAGCYITTQTGYRDGTGRNYYHSFF